ncbi:ubiquitin thioesterase OTUB1 [Caerostris extrusa]|uniref:ubiquitinyl hydrolase 1 n=1 Tax=Caerostris extrusa TaxID=172846 RepID=A0AAV4QC64_CAEEX|nr:ubiquitin thioesterase OTUB1 [Caerostris extrusa]
MEEETERISTTFSKDVNHDEAIMAQEREIEREIAETNPLIAKKVNDLRKKYSYIRKMRPDGNCFFRAFTFAYLESLLTDKQEYKRFKEIASKTKDDLVALGFSQFTIEDFHDTFMDVLGKIEQDMTVEDLLETFNDQGSSDYIVVYMRLITSGHLQKEEAFFTNFIEGERTVKEFCHQEVEPMYKESDHIHVIALTLALGVGARVLYMDRGEGGHVNNHDFPEDKTPRIHLLYRPGHYDILY